MAALEFTLKFISPAYGHSILFAYRIIITSYSIMLSHVIMQGDSDRKRAEIFKGRVDIMQSERAVIMKLYQTESVVFYTVFVQGFFSQDSDVLAKIRERLSDTFRRIEFRNVHFYVWAV